MSHETLDYAEPSTPPRRESAGIVGEGAYDNIPRVVVIREGQRIRLAPAPMRWVVWICVSVVCVVTMSGWCLIVWHGAQPSDRLWGVLAGVGIGIFTVGLVMGIPLSVAYYEKRHGDRLVVDVGTARVELPREGESFALECVQALELCNGWTRDKAGKRDGESNVGEWQLVVRGDDGRERRIVILRESAGTHRRQFHEFASLAPFPVLIATEHFLGGGVSVKPIAQMK